MFQVPGEPSAPKAMGVSLWYGVYRPSMTHCRIRLDNSAVAPLEILTLMERKRESHPMDCGKALKKFDIQPGV
ncbi:MAG: hypothetical protein ACE10C_15205 [Candidatus Binatia bacterium]